MHSKDGSIEYECSAIYTAGAESAPNSQSTNNDNKQRKQERERARYATMSQEEKNARNLRLREACQKKKGDWMDYVFVVLQIHCLVIWMGQNLMVCCQLVASF